MMDRLPTECSDIVSSFRRDPEIVFRRLVDELNCRVRNATNRCRFRPLSADGIVNRAFTMWEDEGFRFNPFGFVFAIQNLYAQWLVNNGVDWTHQERLDAIEPIALHLLDWFRGVI